MKRSGSSLPVLYLATVALQASLNMVFLALPIYALSVSASPLEIGLIGALGGLIYSLMARSLGGLSDRYSKKSFVILGAALEAVVSALYPFCTSTQLLIPVRMIQSLGLALFWPAIEAMIAEETTNETVERVLVGYNISWSTANIASSPLAGFLITAFTLALPFYVSSALAFAIAIILLALLNGTKHDPSPIKAVQTEPVALTSRPRRLAFFLPVIGAFTFAFNSGIVGTLFPVSATRLNISAFQIGLLFFLSNLIQTLVFVFSERLIQKFKKTSFPIGAAAFAVSLTLMALAGDAVAFVPSFLGLGLGQGILYSASLYYLLVEGGENKGHATGSFESTLGLASFLGPLVGGATAQFGPSYPYVTGALESFTILVVELFFRAKTYESDPPLESNLKHTK